MPAMHEHDAATDHQHGTDHAHAAEHAHEHADDGRPRIAFIGAGRVGTALGTAFARAGWQVTAVASRDENNRRGFQEHVAGARAFADPHAVLDEAELIFLTVPDDAVAGAAESLQLYSGQALVHTSGALPASVLAPAQAAGTSIGGFHPLVSFAQHDQAVADLHGATVAIEGDASLMPLLAELAESIGAQPVTLPEGGKSAYAGRLGIDQALTGPLLRGDVGTVRGHIAILRELAPDTLALYVAVARRELDIARRRGALDPDRAGQIESLLDQASG